MDGPIDYHTKSDRERQILYTYINLKIILMDLFTNWNRLIDIENKLMFSKVEMSGRRIN